VIIAGTGWMLHNLRPLLFPDFTINFIFIAIAGMGELVLMLWLLIRGWKIPEAIYELVSDQQQLIRQLFHDIHS